MSGHGIRICAGLMLAALGLGHGACSHVVDCDDMARTSLAVKVVEEGSGAAICDATVSAEQGGALETLKEHDCVYSGLLERSGLFVVTAKRQGYLDTTATVTIGTDECGPLPRTIVMELTPQ